jgi:hypothetical protein
MARGDVMRVSRSAALLASKATLYGTYLFRVRDASPVVERYGVHDVSFASASALFGGRNAWVEMSRWNVPGCEKNLELVVAGKIVAWGTEGLVVQCSVERGLYRFVVAREDLLAEVPDLLAEAEV